MARNAPPGPRGWPGVGVVLPYLRDQPRFLIESYRRYGPVVGFHLLQFRGAILNGAAANRYVLVDAADNFLVAPTIDRAGIRWIVGEGVLFIDDPAHRQQRKLIQPAMHRQRIEDYQRVMVEATQQVLDRWQPGVPLDIAAVMDDLALIVMGRTLFHMDFTGDARALADAVSTVVFTTNDAFRMALARLPLDVPRLGRGGSLRRALALVHRLVGQIIAQHERDGDDAGDVVSMLVAARDDAGGRLTAAQVRDHLLTLFVAGHETVANALAWGFYLLAQHPPVAVKLLAELDTQLHGAPPTAADLDRLPYLEQVTKEILRIYPPATSLFRTAREGFTWQGYTFPAGATIMYSPYVSHHIPEQFPEPDVFRPERFDPAISIPPPSYAYIPFGGGGRSCLGAPFATMEIKTVLATVLQRFRLELVPYQRVVAAVHTTLQPEYGIQMRPIPQDGRAAHSRAPVRGNVVGATPGPP